jgi:UDP-N-acetylmuramyl pentapeptide phosphotransferase/UDP-N-acetylglucosamine-1-phosphate transferase
VDNPEARKLQKVPIPVMGGIAVFFGIVSGGLTGAVAMTLAGENGILLLLPIVASMLMLYVGAMDDVIGLSPVSRLVIEVLVILALIYASGRCVDSFHGLFRIKEFSWWIAVPLTVFSCVGFINAINMIDGVNGLSSGLCMVCCGMFGVAFVHSGDVANAVLAFSMVASLLPFFMHNVFGTRSRMFIGDGGTLMLGMLLTVLAFCALSSKIGLDPLEEKGLCLPAFALAIGCIPLFDALRVMFTRMIHGKSPMKADKSHLHHLFIDMGFSHLGAAMFIIQMNILVLLVWLLSWYLGASLDLQLYIVIAMALAVTLGVYSLMRAQQNGGPVDEEGYPLGTQLWHLLCRLGKWTHKEDKRVWRIVRYFMDFPLLGHRYRVKN